MDEEADDECTLVLPLPLLALLLVGEVPLDPLFEALLLELPWPPPPPVELEVETSCCCCGCASL